MIWPLDAPFIYDEPWLFLSAHDANNNHKLAEIGLYGTVGIPYGPIPTWIYQGFLLSTRSPTGWILLHAGFMVVSTAIGLLLLSRALKLWKWFIPIVLASPYFWFYTRQLGDNSFILAFSAIGLGCYAYFYLNRLKVFLFIAIISISILPVIHFMALPLVLAIALHMALFARHELYQMRFILSAYFSCFLITHARYFGFLFTGFEHFQSHVITGNSTINFWRGWLFPLGGGRLLSGWGLDYFFGKEFFPRNPVLPVIQLISCLGFALVLFGVFLTVRKLFKKRLFSPLDKFLPRYPETIDIRYHFSFIIIVSFVLQIFECGISHSYFYPHYHNGLWIIDVLAAWIAVDRLIKIKWGAWMVSIYGISLVCLLVSIIVIVHARGGTRGRHYGPTIGNQLEVVHALGKQNTRYPVFCTVENFMKYPSIAALRTLCLTDSSCQQRDSLCIDYASNDTCSGRVRVVKEIKGKKFPDYWRED
jgi:hypothetical protein